ncbi:MAG TPA: hypothetical protein VFL77_08030 [Solirubrobacterales bacterium]|nr:hypothetical protein [Solirubrobacterales bacterium]
MFKPQKGALVQAREEGVAGNARLTAALGALLLTLLAAEGVTIPLIGQLREEHILLGMLLLGPVAAKLATTGYRFARYYLGAPAYVHKGPPPTALRLLAPGVVFTTVALFGTGVALLVVGPNNELAFLHKLSFIAWFALMTIHVLGHLLELPGPAFADWRGRGARVGGAGWRLTAIAATLALGAGLALLSLSAAGSWG